MTRNADAGGGDGSGDEKALRKLHQTLGKITEDLDTRWHFNTSIAAIMELLNELHEREQTMSADALRESIRIVTLMLGPFAPYLAQELWAEQGYSGALLKQPWPAFDSERARPPGRRLCSR